MQCLHLLCSPLFWEDEGIALFIWVGVSGSCIYGYQVDDHEDLRGECGAAILLPALACIERACRPSDHVVFIDGVDHIDMASCGQTVEGEARVPAVCIICVTAPAGDFVFDGGECIRGARVCGGVSGGVGDDDPTLPSPKYPAPCGYLGNGLDS